MYTTKRSALGASAVFCAIVSPWALAAPTVSGVSGTLSAGQSVTVKGSGFGTKSSAAPLLWDNFENGTAGKDIQDVPAVVGQWDDGAGSDHVVYTSSTSHTGNMAAAHDFVTQYNASLAKNIQFTRLYMDFWMKVDYKDNKSRNFKPWRLYGPNDDLQLAYVYQCTSNALNRDQLSAGLSVATYGGPDYVNDKWQHFQLVYQESAPNVANGSIHHWINSQAAGMDSDAVVTEQGSAHFNQIRIGHFWAQDAVDNCPSNSGATVYTDDVYLDTSWARVELGDQPTYAASTHREIQIPSAWTDSSVAVQFNPGSFASGSTAYLFVTDANNNTSPGIAVKIGNTAAGGGSPPPPAATTPNAPTDLTVN